jgi:hypothetical protein
MSAQKHYPTFESCQSNNTQKPQRFSHASLPNSAQEDEQWKIIGEEKLSSGYLRPNSQGVRRCHVHWQVRLIFGHFDMTFVSYGLG